MAVESQEIQASTGASMSSGRRFLVGTNVVVMTALVIALVVIIQMIAYNFPARSDWTSSGVNSLSDGTENLLSSLDTDIRLTSLYFETDREEEDQPRYRQAALDLVNLYEATNRGKVRAEWTNPLKDHEKFQNLQKRLREKTAFKEQLDAYQARIDKYAQDLDGRVRQLLQTERDQIAAMAGSLGGSGGQAAIDPVDQALMQTSQILERTRERVDALTLGAQPQISSAIDELRSLYRNLIQTFKNIGKYGTEQSLQNPGLPPEQGDFLKQAGNRYAEMTAAFEEETTQLQALEPLEFDELLGKLAPTANSILVETDEDAEVVDFPSVWPPLNRQGGGRLKFKDRAFKGEEKLTSAILRATHKEQTAVVFVRYGGPPLFFGGFMPGQPPPRYATMKEQLEDANFVVKEWDLKSGETPPEIDPAPTRMLYVVLQPSPPPRDPTGRPSQEPPFSDSQRRAVLDAIGEDGRALFIAGWHPGPWGPIPASYEYADYLKDQWGIEVETSTLLIEAMSVGPGKYALARRDFHSMRELGVTDHEIVQGASARQLSLPMCAPLLLSETPPEGVELTALVVMPQREGVWGETNIPRFLERVQQRELLTQESEDRTGPFDLAVAGTKGDAKTVVISSAEFAVDAVAFATGFAMTAQGFTFRSRNPGNVTLLVNSLHWLNDNTEFMNIGKPIDAAVLQIENKSTVTAVQAFTIFVWPILALVGGGVVWWVRRR